MDLIGVREILEPRTREEISFAPGFRALGGGSWLFSEPQPGLVGLVDLTALGWQPITETDATLSIAATCTIETLASIERTPGFNAHPLFAQCANSLLASWKIWKIATVGGNIALGLPAGPMTSLAAALDADLVIWTTDGGERRVPAVDFVTGVRENALAQGEVLRSIELHRSRLVSRTGFRRIALSPLGRSGTLVIGRHDPSGEYVFTITAGTPRPVQLRFDDLPSTTALAGAVDAIDDWYDDPHGAPDWRRAMSRRFAEELRVELGGAA